MPASQLDKLKAVLAELFMFDQADLDFGIYRIMNARRAEIVRFLDRDLVPQVRETLASLRSSDRAALESELNKALAGAHAAGIAPENSPRVKDLRERYDAAADVSTLEDEIFSYLTNFFRRYYDKGDFIAQRRYKEGVYAIPYEGEEVKLYWANYDQYYIKTSEYFRDYTFTLADGRRAHFKLASADSEQNNNKPASGQEPRFILAEDTPLMVENGELLMRFYYAPDPAKRKQSDLNAAAAQAILASPTARDWRDALAAPLPTDKNPSRTLLDRFLADYTARNTFDYFIHKDLGRFLRRELDFFVKNEVLHLDDIENESPEFVTQRLATVRALRRIAHAIIDLLAQLEDFQKKLWLKKKFVVETNYCVTLDRVPEALYPEIAANDAQRAEWERLFAIDEIKADTVTPGYSDPLTILFLKANPYLVLDTRFFGRAFKDKLLASFDDFDEQSEGLLVRSENYQALKLLEGRYRKQVKCIYIDPPYNTDAAPIIYKNGYRRSSWLSLIENRVSTSNTFLSNEGIICVTIDDYQAHELALSLDNIFDRDNQLGTAVIRNNPSGRSTVKGFSICHEYAFFYRASESANLARLPRSEKQLERFTQEEGIHVDWRNFRKDGGAVTHRAERPKQFYPIYVTLTTLAIRIPKMSWNKLLRQWDLLEPIVEGEIVIWPVDEKGKDRVWSLNHISAINNLPSLEVRGSDNGNIQVFRRHIPSDGVLPRSWWDKNVYAAREHGSAALTNLFGNSSMFSFAKSPFAVQDCIWVAGLDTDSDECVLDYFAGSGTTGHAVINLNREDNGTRKYILVEMGDYFDTVLKPRIQKVVYSTEWKGGKPVSREGSSHLFKYIRLESYEDTINNLTFRRTAEQQQLLEANPDLRTDYTLHYFLDVESRESVALLNLDQIRDPFQYTLEIATGSAGETRPQAVDLVETFNYLLGLRVRHVDALRGFRVVQGLNPAGEKALVIWRNLNEKTNADLDDFFQKQDYNTRDQEFALIYVNGDNNLENLRRPDQTWKVRLIEEEFKRLMFEASEGQA